MNDDADLVVREDRLPLLQRCPAKSETITLLVKSVVILYANLEIIYSFRRCLLVVKFIANKASISAISANSSAVYLD